jgi:hypothetical protein
VEKKSRTKNVCEKEKNNIGTKNVREKGETYFGTTVLNNGSNSLADAFTDIIEKTSQDSKCLPFHSTMICSKLQVLLISMSQL